jgi:hypothetical protein
MELMPGLVEALENAEKLAGELGIKIHSMLSGAPEHVSFLVPETDNPGVLARFANSFPFKQEFKITPVVPEQPLIELAKQLMG